MTVGFNLIWFWQQAYKWHKNDNLLEKVTQTLKTAHKDYSRLAEVNIQTGICGSEGVNA